MDVLMNVVTERAGLCRSDRVIVDEKEFPEYKGKNNFLFRGDDRPPDNIFAEGFNKKTDNYSIQYEKDQVIENIASAEEANYTGKATPFKNPTNLGIYQLRETQIAIRTDQFDLVPDTCISLTENLALTAGFPQNTKTETFIYVVMRPPLAISTYKLQEQSTNPGLADSKEVTCSSVDAGLVVGAIKIKRFIPPKGEKSTSAPKASIYTPWKVTEWLINKKSIFVFDSEGEFKQIVENNGGFCPDFVPEPNKGLKIMKTSGQPDPDKSLAFIVDSVLKKLC